jgi:hypothetical protein
MLSVTISWISKDYFMNETSILLKRTWREHEKMKWREREHSDGINDKLKMPLVTFLTSKSFVTLCFVLVFGIFQNRSLPMMFEGNSCFWHVIAQTEKPCHS